MEELKLPEIDATIAEGKKGILKYFDRIHDKLFTFNNILIGGYFFLAKLEPNVSVNNILWPLANLCWLIFLEWSMMELSRTESKMDRIPIRDLDKQLYSRYGRVSLYSFGAILSTTTVLAIFLKIFFAR